jgi:carboxyl-terminal processing protease
MQINRLTKLFSALAPSSFFASIVSVALLSTPAFAQSTALTNAERLTLTAQVWSLTKYRHPLVSTCQRPWDQPLVDALPAIEGATSDTAFDQQITDLLAKAGAVPAVANAPVPAWVARAPLSASNKALLATIAASKVADPKKACFARQVNDPFAGGLDSRPDFSSDTSFNNVALTRSIRLLAAMRYWGAIEYFFGYKDLIGRPWAGVFEQYVLKIADAEAPTEYAKLVRQFTAEINDSHGYLESPDFDSFYAEPPFAAHWIEGKGIVTGTSSRSGSSVRVGDEITAVNGVELATLMAQLAPTAFGSNPVSRANDAFRRALGTRLIAYTYSFKRPNNTTYNVTAVASSIFVDSLALGSSQAWQSLPVSADRSCSATVVQLGVLQPTHVDAMLASAKNSDLLVIDSRRYPASGQAFLSLVDSVLAKPVVAMAYASPNFTEPGQYVAQPQSELSIGGRTPIGFNGKVIVLVNEQSQSFSEYVAMVFQQRAGTIVMGSQTSGANGGNIDGLKLPGNITVQFTSDRLTYPDGRHMQRIGIVPDVHVVPTIAGIRAGQDELLNAATDCKWKSAAPAARQPRSGLYYDPKRNGEGIEVHKIGQRFMSILYTYDDEKLPTWVFADSDVKAGVWDSPLLRGQTGQPFKDIGKLKIDYQSGPYALTCAIADQSKTTGRATINWPLLNQTSANAKELCLEPIAYNDGSAFSGLWAGPDAELGWGLGVHHIGDTFIVLMYAYDGAGKPRWLTGTTTWNGRGEVQLKMQRTDGFCNTCDATTVQFTDAGTLTLNLANTTPGVQTGNSVSIDVRFHDGSRWQRDKMPLRKL